MDLFRADHWPLWLIAAVMILVAIINCGPAQRIPNAIVFPFIVGGWVLGALHFINAHPDAGKGDILGALAGTAFGLALLLPALLMGAMGAGSVKLQMGFGSWAGAFYGMPGLYVVFYATVAAILLWGVQAAVVKVTNRPLSWQKSLPTGVAQAVGGIATLVGYHSS
jgi:Flp pilus assembly protein protease CpaA